MPTKRPRHTITETPPVAAALTELRAATGGERINLGELVVLGAQTMVDRLRTDSEDQRGARERLAARIRARSIPGDVDAADEVKLLGLLAPDP